ncbi:unnamed protein product [Caenorhabditis nigoni]
MHIFFGFVFLAVLATIQAIPTLSTDVQALIRTTQETGNEIVFSTSPTSSSSPSIQFVETPFLSDPQFF